METANQDTVFHGLHDLIVNFWGLSISSFDLTESVWDNTPVVFLDTDDSEQGNPLVVFLNSGVGDMQELTFVSGGKEFNVLAMTGDGGFISCLIRHEDFEELNTSTGGGLVPVIHSAITEKD